VPLRYKLHNGDTVEIITSPQQSPSKDWLEFVSTGRARSRIRNFIRSEERRGAVKLGKELVERAFHKHDKSFSRWEKKNGNAVELPEQFQVATADELYARVGYGKLSAQEVYDAAVPTDEEAEALRPSFFEKTVRRVTGKNGHDSIRIDDVDDVLVRFAKCCNPLPGDPITGWITRGRGVSVHRRGCEKAMELDPERRVEVSWSDGVKVDRPVALRVATADRPGILANVSAAFTENGVNIQEANCRVGDDGSAVNMFSFTVSDVSKLRSLMRRISQIEGVYDVQRT